MYLLETARTRVLVDCGMYQGERRSRAENERPFPFVPSELDAVLLTHAHIDHSGLVPKLVRDGFRGKVHVTAPSAELLGILLRDSAHLHEQDTLHENRRRRRAGKRPLEPLYELADVERTLARLVEHPFDRVVTLADGFAFRYARAGHILGAASIECRVRDGTFERTVVFSGDVGREHEPMLLPPEPPRGADLVLLESTYGDRDHKPLDATIEELAQALVAASADGGNVLVPVFAVGRAQEILHYIGKLEREGRIPELPVYLDSPMAISASELYRRHSECFQTTDGGRRCETFEPRRLELCRTPEESMRLNELRGIVILSASGMCEGGRILHPRRHNLWRATTDVVIVGFQARGTLGRALVEGSRSVRIFGESVAVAAKVNTLGGFSAHAGRSELVRWVAPLIANGAQVALVHGEDDKCAALAAELQARLGALAWQPQRGERVSLRKRGTPLVLEPSERAPERRRTSRHRAR
ncbi:MAG: MBL fold metallo-hydrolase [Planctomycetes bacterium]|nr:MBL fold metallo-hydrolase [Planctomycetota bacterium]